jgi:putative addiction module killer protein
MSRVEVRTTLEFDTWLRKLRDGEARSRVLARIARLAFGNAGDSKSVGEGVLELRVAYGPGYRVYYTYADAAVVVLLTGGDKATQDRDIAQAKRLARGL